MGEGQRTPPESNTEMSTVRVVCTTNPHELGGGPGAVLRQPAGGASA